MLTQQHGARDFQVLPAVDVLAGSAVRLERGRFDRVVAREPDPAALLERFVTAGARLVHVVDLDAARTGSVRPELAARLAEAAGPARIQLAGGVRSVDDALRLLAAGAARVVVGTAAFASPDALARFRDSLGDALVVALDVRDGRIVVGGWTADGGLSVAEAADRCREARVPRVACTAVERDGMLAGPDLELLELVAARSGAAVLAAGGIRSEDDLRAVERLGCEGAIVGRALLEGTLALDRLGARA